MTAFLIFLALLSAIAGNGLLCLFFAGWVILLMKPWEDSYEPESTAVYLRKFNRAMHQSDYALARDVINDVIRGRKYHKKDENAFAVGEFTAILHDMEDRIRAF